MSASVELKHALCAEPILPLASILRSRTEGPFSLRVFSQEASAPPHAAPLAPPLSPSAVLLRRTTGYLVGATGVSRHVAFVDLGRIDGELATQLRTGRTDLGRIFEDPRVRKSLLATGDEASAQDEVLTSLAAREPRIERFLWRRYAVDFERRAAFLVIELLDLSSIARVLRPGASAPGLER